MSKELYKPDIENEEGIKKLCENFLDKINEEKYYEAYEMIKPYFPISEKDYGKILEETAKQLPKVKTKFGKTIGYSLAKKQENGKIFIKYTYIQKYEISVIRWSFTFYKPKKNWIINDLTFDENKEMIF